MRKPIEERNGITIKILREWLAAFPDDGEVWIGDVGALSSQVHCLYEVGDGSVMLSHGNPAEM